MRTDAIGKTALAMVAALVGACSTEVRERQVDQSVSDASAASGGARAAGGAAAGGSSFHGGGGGAEAATGGSSFNGSGGAAGVAAGGSGGAGGRNVTNCLPPLAPDAGSTAMYECSSDVTRPTEWRWAQLCGTAVHVGCPWQFGCEAFDAAREAVRACQVYRFGPPPYEAKEHGFLVIGDSFGLSVIRVYYDAATREMVGYFEMDDVGEIVCAGRVPRATFGVSESLSITDIVPLCERDGGVLGDGGTGKPFVDAGDSG